MFSIQTGFLIGFKCSARSPRNAPTMYNTFTDTIVLSTDTIVGSVKLNADAKTRSVNPQICSIINQIME